MSMLSKAVGGGGGAIGGLVGGPLGAIGGSLFGNMFGGSPSVPNVGTPSWGGDQSAFQGWYDKQKNLYTDQQKQLQDLLNKQRQNAMTNLTTGPEGEQMREQYNRLGLLNSGAFNQGLSDRFAQIEQGTEQQLGQLGMDQTNALANLNLSGMGRQFGLEDLASSNAMQQALANAQLQSQYRGQNLGFLGSLIGAGGSILGGAMGGG